MKLNLMSLGDIVADPYSGRTMSAQERYRMTIDAAVIADRTGFNGINVGEHHGIAYTFSAPPVLLAAIAERTTRLRLGTSVALAAISTRSAWPRITRRSMLSRAVASIS